RKGARRLPAAARRGRFALQVARTSRARSDRRFARSVRRRALVQFRLWPRTGQSDAALRGVPQPYRAEKQLGSRRMRPKRARASNLLLMEDRPNKRLRSLLVCGGEKNDICCPEEARGSHAHTYLHQKL